MQHNEEKRRRTRDGVARARILLKKHMGWLPGFLLRPQWGFSSSAERQLTNYARQS
jgi:hypothetical protein